MGTRHRRAPAFGLICIPPLIAAYKAISNKRKLLVFAAFLIIPLILDTIIILIALNGLLQKGVLSQVWLAGTPLLITMWFVLCAIIVVVNFKWLKQFTK